jgi:hypothetical protein
MARPGGDGAAILRLIQVAGGNVWRRDVFAMTWQQRTQAAAQRTSMASRPTEQVRADRRIGACAS